MNMRQLFEAPPGPFFKSCLGPLAIYGTHQETISGRLEQSYLLSDQDWNGLGRGRYLSQTQVNAGGRNAATIRVKSWAIIEVRPAALAQIWHPPGNHKWGT